jgi:hypothetical protein
VIESDQHFSNDLLYCMSDYAWVSGIDYLFFDVGGFWSVTQIESRIVCGCICHGCHYDLCVYHDYHYGLYVYHGYHYDPFFDECYII